MPKAEKKREEQEKARKAAEEAAKLVDIRSQLKGFDARAWFIETLKYVSWVVVFTMSIFANRGTANQYNYVDLWRAQARAGIPDPFATGEHFWEMISGENGLLKMLGPAALVERNEDGNATGFFTYPSSEGDYGLAYKSPLGANETITRLAWNGNAIVDGIWLRQLRISSINCTKFGKLAQVILLLATFHTPNFSTLNYAAGVYALFPSMGLRRRGKVLCEVDPHQPWRLLLFELQ